ncbi:DUF3592 domain-containing protein [Streptomyces hyaluromycini]|uniref:DUF3592 domain-containing protein n=1 Tax=Streptomyces hyaluromycini TaxID=1377993 RepID=UPI000B5C5565|nr:DUF3592 domain-containing protein [Streptomyces hyaluromycini]
MGEFIVEALLSAVFAGATVAVGRDARRVHGVRRRGIRTTGIVIDIRETTDGDGDAQLYPQVRYTLPDGRKVTGEGGGHAIRSPLSEGDGVELLYRPEDPERIILIAYDRHMNIWVYGGLSLLLGAMALLCALSAVVSLSQSA